MSPLPVVSDMDGFPPLQAFLLTVLLLLMFVVAITGVCSVTLWCYLFVCFDRQEKKPTITEYFL